jgi:hypothetical protein
MTMINDLGRKATGANPMKFLVPVAEDVVIELDAHNTGNNPWISRENVVVYIKGVSGHAGTFQPKSSALNYLLYAGRNQQLIIKDLILRGHDANNFPLVYLERGQLHMKSGSEITGNYNTGVRVYADATLTMSGDAKIYGNKSAGVQTASGSRIIMNDYASIYNNESPGSGGGISGGHVEITMNGHASVYGNTAAGVGGGISLGNRHGWLIMNDDASVYGNTAAVKAGGLFRGYDTSHTINDNASISGNVAPSGTNIGY